MKKIIAYLLLLTLLLSGCSQNDSVGSSAPPQQDNDTSQNANVTTPSAQMDPNAERYTMKSTLTDWETEYTVSTDVKHIVDNRGHNAYVTAEIRNVGENPIFMGDLMLEGYALKDASGTYSDVQLFEQYYPVVLYPGETGYLHGVTITRSLWQGGENLTVVWQEDGISHTCLTVADAEELFSMLKTSDEEVFINDDGNLQMKGKVTNSSASEHTSIRINAVLFDKAGALLGLFTGSVDSLAANEAAEFALTGYPAENFDIADVASWKVEAYSTN